jgi:hypothetical protein
MLRDALLLRHGGDDPGPAGRLRSALPNGLHRSLVTGSASAIKESPTAPAVGDG